MIDARQLEALAYTANRQYLRSREILGEQHTLTQYWRGRYDALSRVLSMLDQ